MPATAKSPKIWLVPAVFITLLSALLPAVYLTATVDPQNRLKDLRIALVQEPQTVQATPSAARRAAQAITANVDRDKIDLVTMSPARLATEMRDGDVAGAIVIPADFDRAIGTLLQDEGTITVPQILVHTDAGAGGINTGLVNGNLTPLLKGVGVAMGKQLTATAQTQDELTASSKALLSQPFTIASTPYRTLPEHNGNGTSAFYYTLVIVLLGFIGASIINPSVDSALGFAPTEVGPFVTRGPYQALTRFQTLVIKFGVITVCAPIAAALLQFVGAVVIGLPVSSPWLLWLFSTISIAAIGYGALAAFAVFGGGIGALVNTTFFIALSMTSSGGTVPLAATPGFFRWLSNFGPYHGVLEGVRAVFYYDAVPAAGLTFGWVHVIAGAAIGLALGGISTLAYDRYGFSRHPAPTSPGLSETN
jgi:uncharacterized phage infection (PIP) family protein YhgE